MPTLESRNPRDVLPVRWYRRTVARVLFRVLVGTICLLALVVSFVCGLFIGEGQAKHRQVVDETRRIRQVLDGHGVTYSGVTVAEESVGRVRLEGSVRSESDRLRLKEEMQALFGVGRGEDVVGLVNVALASQPAGSP